VALKTSARIDGTKGGATHYAAGQGADRETVTARLYPIGGRCWSEEGAPHGGVPSGCEGGRICAAAREAVEG
jgi:hypothetical protein